MHRVVVREHLGIWSDGSFVKDRITPQLSVKELGKQWMAIMFPGTLLFTTNPFSGRCCH